MANSLRRDLVALKLELRRPEGPFLSFDNQAKLLKALKEFSEVTLVISWCRNRDEDVINVRKYSRKAARHLGNEPLKCLSCVASPEWHAHILKQAERCSDDRLRDISMLDGDLVMRLDKVHLAKDFAPFQVACEILDVGRG